CARDPYWGDRFDFW
nr:immunoglobulin heavy chain junction region [Macaca mulatta]MOW77539.1 immunoglobulin heavy chain junction region [Macaca mulatta]MOW78742.1 immunoglobulin heavy chain junction region [Macaca mulatta]MOW80567.1 immunoglobulin heavy chain junction region [Macaca mulatta]MOW82739.1 immunoglobulin heavy chain junction region [Macaca mulatta]